MALNKTKTTCTVSFENHENGMTYRYDATHEENAMPSRINFSIEKDAMIVARGYQGNVNGTFSFEVLRQMNGFDRAASQLVIDADLAKICDILK